MCSVLKAPGPVGTHSGVTDSTSFHSLGQPFPLASIPMSQDQKGEEIKVIFSEKVDFLQKTKPSQLL